MCSSVFVMRAGGGTRRVAVAALLAIAVALIVVPRVAADDDGGLAAGDRATVQVPGSCLQLREDARLSATPLTCLPHGSSVTLRSDTAVERDGHTWREVRAGAREGWLSERFLRPVPTGGGSNAAVAPSEGGMSPITYYFCERGENRAGWGDGGGFCGAARSGEIVYPGMAACSAENFGQRFRIDGDPLDRIYTCEDTGSAVHGDHRDIWFHNSDEGLEWVAAVGSRAEITIVEEGEPLPPVTAARSGPSGSSDNNAPEPIAERFEPDPPPPEPAGEFVPEPAADGLTMTVFDGSFEQFDEQGATFEVTSCFATVDGGFIGYTFGAPDFTNTDFLAAFEDGLDEQLLICRRG